MKRDSIVIFREQLEALGALGSLKDLRTVVDAIIEYGMNGNKNVEIPEHLKFGWAMMKSKLDSVNAYEEELKEKRKQAAGKRWQPQQDTMQMDTNDASGCKSMQMDTNDASGCYPYPYPQDKNININNITHAHEEKGENPGYPKSVDDIISIASRHGIKILFQDAQNYLDDRMRKDWTVSGSRVKMPISSIPGDIRIWANNADNKHIEQQKDKRNENSNSSRPRQKLGF